MSISELKTQIQLLKQRISQLRQFGYEEEVLQKEDVLLSLEKTLERREFDLSQIELEQLLKEKEEKPKRTRRRRTRKAVEEDTPE